MPKSRYKKRADGRYLAQIPTGEYREDGKPKLKNIYARTQAELDAKIAEFRRQVEMGRIIEDTNITVGQWGTRWLEAYKGGLEFKTEEMYTGALRKHIIPAIGTAKMRSVRRHHLQELINAKSQERNDDGALKYGKRTLEIMLLTLRQIFSTAESDGVIGVDPAKKVTLPQKVEKPKAEKRALTEQEDKLFLKLVQTHEHGLFFMTLYYSGMRPEEARALVLQDLDFSNDEIVVDEASIFVGDAPVLKGCKTKKSIRRIPMPAPLKAVLRAYRPPQGILLFPGKHGGLMDKKEYTAAYESLDAEMNRMAGGNETIRALDRFTPYILRHNYATTMAEANVPIKYLSEIMGSSEETLMKYYVHVSDRQRRASEELIKNWYVKQEDAKSKSVKNQSVKQK